jgi:ketosteroid isomerase-like protein
MRERIGLAMLVVSCGFTAPRTAAAQGAVVADSLLKARRPRARGARSLARWNATEVYSRIDGRWRIVHSHWSYVKPDLKQPGP